MNNHRNNWLTAILLTLPVAVFFAGYLFNHAAAIHPTGFIQYDNVAYIAYAKQYLDADNISLLYSNPFGVGSPAIYFQPQTLFFALLVKSGIPPGWILIPFTLICSVIVFRILINIYDHLSGNQRFRTWNLWLLGWGGGLLVVAGIVSHYYVSRPGPLYRSLFWVDPEGGWWGLNLGRSLIFSCEAYYHALFLGCILSVLKQKWKTACLLMFILSLSHPFTGLELSSIICGWCLFELITKTKAFPVWFGVVSVIILAMHLYYYLFYLEQFADHRSVSTQYSLNWKLRFYRMIPAYILVGTLAMVTSFKKGFRNFFAIRSNRILFAWFVVAFLLANHEVFMAPKQPVHFTRGYIWTSLFLLGLPALLELNSYCSRKWKVAGFVLFGLVFFMDNFAWITVNTLKKTTSPDITYISLDQKKVLRILNNITTNQTLVISNDIIRNDNTLSYLSSVYTKAIPWYSHPFTTPFASVKKSSQDRFFTNGIPDHAWAGRPVAFIIRKNDSGGRKVLSSHAGATIFETDDYVIYMYQSFK